MSVHSLLASGRACLIITGDIIIVPRNDQRLLDLEIFNMLDCCLDCIWIYCPKCWWSDCICRPKASNSLEAARQHCLIEGAGFQILSVLTSKLWPNFTWQDVVFCLIQKNCSFGRGSGLTWDALWRQWGELGNRGWWVMDTECAARACCLCCGADGPPHCSARCPSFLICCPSPQSRRSRRRTFGVFVLPSPGVVGFLRRSLAICWIVFRTAWFVVRLFCFSVLAGFQGELLSGSVHILGLIRGFSLYICVSVQDICKSWKSFEFCSLKKKFQKLWKSH